MERVAGMYILEKIYLYTISIVLWLRYLVFRNSFDVFLYNSRNFRSKPSNSSENYEIFHSFKYFSILRSYSMYL